MEFVLRAWNLPRSGCLELEAVVLGWQVKAMKFEIDVPESTFSALRQTPEEFASSLREIAAVKWYEIGRLSQERAAELAGQSRQEFLLTLSRYRISPFQGVEADLEEIRGQS